jgi:hypothetical protein
VDEAAEAVTAVDRAASWPLAAARRLRRAQVERAVRVSAENAVISLAGLARLSCVFHARARLPDRSEFGKGW